MKRWYKLLIFIFGLVLLVAVGTIMLTQQYSWASASIAQSQGTGRFIRRYSCSPKQFKFKNHDVVVQQCWLEKPKEGKISQIVLTLMFDHKPYGELHMQQQKGENIVFKHVDAGYTLFKISRCSPLINVSEMWTEIVSQKASHRFAHIVDLAEPFPDEFDLQVCSQKDSKDTILDHLGANAKDEGVTLTLKAI